MLMHRDADFDGGAKPEVCADEMLWRRFRALLRLLFSSLTSLFIVQQRSVSTPTDRDSAAGPATMREGRALVDT